MNENTENTKSVKYTYSLAMRVILDMITKDIRHYELEELPYDKENHKIGYLFTREVIDYEDFE
jgi:hypothetical protein